MKSPQSTIDTTPLYIAGGFKYDQERNEQLAARCRTLGHTVLPALPNIKDSIIDPKSCIVGFDDGTEKIASRWEAYRLGSRDDVGFVISGLQLLRARQLNEHVRNLSKDPINVIAQSADFQYALLAALEEPELYKNIVGAFPASVHRRPSLFGYQAMMLNRKLRSRGQGKPVSDETMLESIKKRRYTRSGGMAVMASVGVSYAPRHLAELHKKPSAPGLAIVLGVHDSTILAREVVRSIDLVQDVDLCVVTNSRHGVKGNDDMLKMMLGLFPRLNDITASRIDERSVDAVLHFADDVCAIERNHIRAAAER